MFESLWKYLCVIDFKEMNSWLVLKIWIFDWKICVRIYPSQGLNDTHVKAKHLVLYGCSVVIKGSMTDEMLWKRKAFHVCPDVLGKRIHIMQSTSSRSSAQDSDINVPLMYYSGLPTFFLFTLHSKIRFPFYCNSVFTFICTFCTFVNLSLVIS